jgi:hypothetical protein
MSDDIRTDHEYQVAEFGDFGFRMLNSEASQEGERFSSIMALEDCSIQVISSRYGDDVAEMDLLAGMIIYGDLAVTSLTGKVIAYLRDK